MKRVIAVVAMLSAGSLLADGDDGANTYGLMTVSSSDQRTIVAIPWIQASLTNGEITVADVVRTANLAEGDSIHYYNTSESKFESWRLNSSTQWEAATSVTVAEKTNGTAAEEKVLTRGNALVLIRTNGAHRASCVYLWGQVASNGVTTSITNSGYTLIAPPVTNEVATIDLNQVATWSGVSANDRIYIQTSTNTVECKYDSGTWKKYEVTGSKKYGDFVVPTMGWVNVGSIITLGTGFWYCTAVPSPTVSVTWSGVPTVTTAAE